MPQITGLAEPFSYGVRRLSVVGEPRRQCLDLPGSAQSPSRRLRGPARRTRSPAGLTTPAACRCPRPSGRVSVNLRALLAVGIPMICQCVVTRAVVQTLDRLSSRDARRARLENLPCRSLTNLPDAVEGASKNGLGNAVDRVQIPVNAFKSGK